jgi:copper transport protein
VTANRRRPLGRAILPALAALLFALAPAQPAQAHAVLLSTDPADGTILDRAPETVTLHFNEQVQPVGDATRLVDGNGGDHLATTASSDGDVVVTLPGDLPDGPYYLNWRVVSADDHPISGVLSFAVGTETPPPAPVSAVAAEPDPPWAVRAVNVLHYLGLLVFGGLVCFRAAIARELSPPRPRHRLLRAAGVTAAAAAALAVPVSALDLAGLPLSRLLDVGAWRDTVQAEAAMTLALTLAGLALAYASLTRGRPPWASLAAPTGAALAVWAPILVGHTMTYDPRWLMLAADMVHLATAAIWTGGLAGLVIVLGRLREGDDAVPAAVVVSRFSTWAGYSVAALGASGIAMAWMIHREWDGVFGSDHGKALIVKVGLVAVAVALAGWNRFRLVPLIRGDDPRAGLVRLRRIVKGEAVVVAAVIALTGVLVSLSPAEDEPAASGPPAAVEEHETEVLTVTGAFGDGGVEVHVSPLHPGENTVHIALTDAEGLPLEPLEPPTVSAVLPEEDFGPVAGEVHELGDGQYHCLVDLPLTGAWKLTVQARVSEFASESAVVTVEL